ncbi:hypothetical protein ACHQM5_023557 [Ranunculus cassubicifolius]
MTIPTGDSHLRSDSIPVIDLRYLSQPELTSLSLCSSSTFDLHRCDDIIIPKINRSVFNESAGSRKQTYSKLRLAPRKPEISAVGRGRYNPVQKPHMNPVDDPERKENKEIVKLLRGLFGKDSEIQFKEEKNSNLDLVMFDANNHEKDVKLPVVVATATPPTATPPEALQLALVSVDGNGKRKRGRPRKDGVNGSGSGGSGGVVVEPKSAPSAKSRKVENEDYYENVSIDENVVMEIVNKNGVVVDLNALSCNEDPYGGELRMRSMGLTKEEELLDFLRGLSGQWGSRRKKRKVVDASDFGDALPIGWKLLLSLRRKEGNLSLYCRRYISPTGQQFVTCKEVSSYLLPFFGFQDENQANPFQSDESDYEANKMSSGCSAGLAQKDCSTKQEIVCYDAAPSPIASVSSEHEKPLAITGTENLAEGPKRARHGNTSVCDGVIIRDGKFECQFCHKVFDEKHRYNGHVGVHVRNYVKSLEQSPGETGMQNKVKSSSASGVLPRLAGVDASADIDKISAVTSLPINETNLQKHNNIAPLSVSGVLSGPSEVDSTSNAGKATAVTSIPINETSFQNHIKPSTANVALPESCGVDVVADTGKGSAVASVSSDVTSLQKNVKPSSVSVVLPGILGVDATSDTCKGSAVTGTSPSMPPSSSCFPTFDLTSNKGQGGSSILSTCVKNPEQRDGGNGYRVTEPVSSLVQEDGTFSLPAATADKTSGPALTSLPISETSLQNNVKPSDVSEILPGSSAEAASADTTKGSSVTSLLINEASLPNDAEESSVNKFLPGSSEVHELLDTDKDSELSSFPANETSVPTYADPSSVKEVLQRLSGVSADIDKSSRVSSTPIIERSSQQNDKPSSFNETSLQNNVVPSSTSGMLPGLFGAEASAIIDKESSVISMRISETMLQNKDKPSLVSNVLPGSSGMEVSDGFISVTSVTSDQRATESIFNTSSPSEVLPEILEVESSASLEKQSTLLTSSPSNDEATQNNVNPLGMSSVHPKLTGTEASDGISGSSAPVTSMLSEERATNTNLNSSSGSEVLPWIPEAEKSASIGKHSALLTSIFSYEASTLNNITPLSVGSVLPASSTPGSDGNCGASSVPSDEITAQNDVKLSSPSRVFPGLFGRESSPSSDECSVPLTTSPLNNLNVHTDAKPSFMSRMLSEFSDEESDDSGHNYFPPTSMPSTERKFVSSPGEQDVDSNLNVKPYPGQSVSRSEPDTGSFTPKSFFLNSNVEKIGSPLDKWGSGFFPQCSTPTANFELNVGPPGIKLNMGANRGVETSGGKSVQKQVVDSEMTDGKVGRIDKINYDMNLDLRSFLDSRTPLCNNVEDLTPENFNIKDGLPRETDAKYGSRFDQTNIDLDVDLRSCLGSAAALHNNVEHGTDTSYKGNNLFTSTDLGINLSGLNQGEGSFTFPFAPASVGRTNGLGMCMDDVFSSRNPKLDLGSTYGLNEQERRFGPKMGLSNKGSFAGSCKSAEKVTTWQSLVTGTSSMLPSSNFIPTLDLMSNKGQGESRNFSMNMKNPELDRGNRYGFNEPVRGFGTSMRQPINTSSPLLQPSNCVPTLDLMSSMGQGESGNFSMPKYDNMSGFDDLGFDDLDSSKFGFVSGKGTQEPMDMSYDTVLEDALNNSVQFEWESMMPKMHASNNNNSNQHQQQQRPTTTTTSICMWCRTPFNHEGVEQVMQSESVGFMCPTCKLKLSGQLNVFGQ